MIVKPLALAGVLAGAAFGLAGPAAAENPLNGTYTATTVDGTIMQPGETSTWLLTPCGENCVVLEVNPPNAEHAHDLHLQDNTWSGTYELGEGVTCTVTIDNGTLDAVEDCPPDIHHHWTLAKNS